MTCPFAKFAGILPASAAHVHALHGLDAAPISDTNARGLSLSDALRLGTARSHRAVEKSRGVSLLLQTTATAADAADEGLSFDRTDYTRFNIMLACIYTVLESAMISAQSTPLIAPLFEDPGLMAGLARSAALLADVHAHLDTIHAHTGADLTDLADHARDDHSTSSTLPEDTEDPLARARLLVLVQAATPHALSLTRDLKVPVLGEEHIALLRPAQVHATLAYVERLTHIRPDLLLAHAYTRYLGDLSGGQHIVRKVTKRFPTPTGGFAFYAFHNPTHLKTRFRTAMHAQHLTKAQMQEVVDEANTAFDCNTALFESLLPAHWRQPSQDTHKSTAVHTGTKPTQLPIAAWIVVAAATATITAAWLAHSPSTAILA